MVLRAGYNVNRKPKSPARGRISAVGRESKRNGGYERFLRMCRPLRRLSAS